MHAAYGNAVVTIVLADRIDAQSGIRGLQNTSTPRNNTCILEIPDGLRLSFPGTSSSNTSSRNERGWTFQKYLFSHRTLIFVADNVRWECLEVCYIEEHKEKMIMPTNEAAANFDPENISIQRTLGLATVAFSNMIAFNTLADGFNGRKFTYGDDVIDASSGVLGALAKLHRWLFMGCPGHFGKALLWRADLIVITRT
jgi:hypothetical protein